MSSDLFAEVPSWEERASEMRKNNTTLRVMAVLAYRLEFENVNRTDTSQISDYFRRVQWPLPQNLSSIANHLASRGSITRLGIEDGRKQWALTKKGYQAFKAVIAQATPQEA